jgi:hypothetical protein
MARNAHGGKGKGREKTEGKEPAVMEMIDFSLKGASPEELKQVDYISDVPSPQAEGGDADGRPGVRVSGMGGLS